MLSEVADNDKELDDLRKERDALKKAQQGVDQHAKASVAAALAQSASQRQSVEQELRQTKDKMQELSKRFPKGIEYAMHYDTTRFVSAAMHDVVVTLLQALGLVVAVVFVFLQSWRTTIIPTIAIPVYKPRSGITRFRERSASTTTGNSNPFAL